MKKLLKFLLVVLILAALVFLGLRLINTCDGCGETFFGLGYEGNVIDNAVHAEKQVLCEECAELHHALSLTFGKTLEDFQRELIPENWEELIPAQVKEWMPDGE